MKRSQKKGRGKREEKSLCPSAGLGRCPGPKLSCGGTIRRVWTEDAALHLPIPKKSEECVAFSLLGQCFDSGTYNGPASPTGSSSCAGTASSQIQF